MALEYIFLLELLLENKQDQLLLYHSLLLELQPLSQLFVMQNLHVDAHLLGVPIIIHTSA